MHRSVHDRRALHIQNFEMAAQGVGARSAAQPTTGPSESACDAVPLHALRISPRACRSKPHALLSSGDPVAPSVAATRTPTTRGWVCGRPDHRPNHGICSRLGVGGRRSSQGPTAWLRSGEDDARADPRARLAQFLAPDIEPPDPTSGCAAEAVIRSAVRTARAFGQGEPSRPHCAYLRNGHVHHEALGRPGGYLGDIHRKEGCWVVVSVVALREGDDALSSENSSRPCIRCTRLVLFLAVKQHRATGVPYDSDDLSSTVLDEGDEYGPTSTATRGTAAAGRRPRRTTVTSHTHEASGRRPSTTARSRMGRATSSCWVSILASSESDTYPIRRDGMARESRSGQFRAPKSACCRLSWRCAPSRRVRGGVQAPLRRSRVTSGTTTTVGLTSCEGGCR